MGLAPTKALRPLPVFGTGPSSGRIASLGGRGGTRTRTGSRPSRVAGGFLIWPVPFHVEPSVGVAPTTSSIPGTCSDSLSYKGVHRCLAGTTRTCDPRLRRAVLSSTELRRAGVDGRGRTCNLRFRRPASSPFDYVDKVLLGATDRIRTDDLLLDRQLLSPLSYGGSALRASTEQCASWASNPVSSGVRARFPTSQE